MWLDDDWRDKLHERREEREWPEWHADETEPCVIGFDRDMQVMGYSYVVLPQ